MGIGDWKVTEFSWGYHRIIHFLFKDPKMDVDFQNHF